MKKMITLLLLAACACASQAQNLLPTTVGLHLGTKHSSAGYNNTNPGVYARWDSGMTAGVYYNSERATSAYAGYLWETGAYTPLQLQAGLLLGVVTGYRARQLTPLLVPSLSAALPATDWRARLTYVPKAEKGSAHALHLSIERNF